MKTAIITSESSEKHITGDGHPEQPKRVVSIVDTLKKNKELLWDKPSVVPNDILNMTHSEDSDVIIAVFKRNNYVKCSYKS